MSNIFDEIYQAALEAGSGGIRYNDTAKRIQLMDTNKNWVDWKRFDAYSQFEFVAVSNNSTTYNFTKEGYYLIFGLTNNSGNSISGSVSRSVIANSTFSINNSTRGYFIVICDAIEGDNISVGLAGSATYGSGLAIYYLGLNNITGSLSNIKTSTGSSAITSLSISNLSNHILIGWALGDGSNRSISITSTTLQKHSGNNFACVSTIDETGSGTITATGGGNAAISFVADILIN